MKGYQMLILLFIVSITSSCTNKSETTNIIPSSNIYNPPANMVEKIVASDQRIGNVSNGYDYLINGNYITQGIELQSFQNSGLTNNTNELNRTGVAATIPFNYNLININGKSFVTSNCLKCHASYINNKFVLGLGNSFYDSEGNIPSLSTPVIGANIGDKLGEYFASTRDSITLQKITTSNYIVDANVVPTDVPPWWILKKKNAMYYATWGRGDFARINMAAILLSVKDSSEARQIDNHFIDLVQYIKSLNPPKYPNAIDNSLVTTGQKIFISNCSGCHGTYDIGNVSYPNSLINIDLVGTDATVIKNTHHTDDFGGWYNKSWFSKPPFAARFPKTNGYLAPPLDGIWATAPFLHNGSIPTLDDLLNSSQRPKIWRRSGKNDDLDWNKVGWNYTIEKTKIDKYTYDTTMPGYGNQGHTFGDGLSASDRKAVIEYLKTL